MAKSKASIKSRIKSINTTKKITGAMKVISDIKFQKELKLLKKNDDYAKTLKSTVNKILASNVDVESKYIVKPEGKRYCFVFLSDLGLCGGYNINLCKYIDENYNNEDLFYVIGSSQSTFFNKKNLNRINSESINSDEIDYAYLKKAMQNALEMYCNHEVGSIEIIYTSFINNMSFKPDSLKVLPYEKEDNEEKHNEVLFEPDASTVIDSLIPLMAYNTIYNCYIQAKTTEQASRRFAMENATDNANDLLEELTLQYNQARQAAITQEITEIIGGADAL